MAITYPIPALPRDENNVPLQQTYNAIVDGRQTVSSAGTAVALVASATSAKRIDITALETNTKVILVGASTVLATAGSQRGVQLEPTGSYTLFLTDLSKIFIDAQVNGEGVSYVYFN